MNSIRHTSLVSVFASVLLTAAVSSAQASWQAISQPNDPSQNALTDVFAWDDISQLMIWLGRPSAAPFGTTEVWAFDGTTWFQIPSLGTAPPSPFRATWDPLRRCIVAVSPSVTSEWHAGVWTTTATPGGPQIVTGTMCYDRARSVTLLYGGSFWDSTIGDSVYLTDLWQWDGAVWTLLPTTPNGPRGREWAAMASDPLSGRVVMHGGWVTYADPFACLSCPPIIAVHLSDTWEWDGTVWHPATAGPQLKAHAMVWDEARDVMTIFGGSGSTSFLDDTYDRTASGAWISRQSAVTPGARNDPQLAFDPLRQRLHLIGGYHNRDQAVLQTTTPATERPVGAGCAGSVGVPQLEARTRPWLGSDWSLTVSGAPATTTSVFALFEWTAVTPTIDLTAIGMPTCALHLGSIAATASIPTIAGVGELTLAIGNDPALAGVPIVAQTFVPDPAANALGLTSTRALASVVGIR